jgi:hypothetical protein
VEKMNIYREKIDDKKMIRATDQEGCFGGFEVKGKKDVDVKKRTEHTYCKKKKIDLCSASTINR